MLTLPRSDWKPVLQLISPYRVKLVTLGGVSLLGGLAEASFLVLATRTALALVDTEGTITVMGGLELSIWPAILVAAVLVIGRLLLALIGISIATRVTARAGTSIRNQLTSSFLHASWPRQEEESSGEFQQILVGFTRDALNIVIAVGIAIAALLSLLALVGMAFVLNPAASLLIIIALVGLGLTLTPLRTRLNRLSRVAAERQLASANKVAELGSIGLEMQVLGVRDKVISRIQDLTDREMDSRREVDFLNQSATPAYVAMAYSAVIGSLAIAGAVGIDNIEAVGTTMLVMLRSLTYGQQLQNVTATISAHLPILAVLDQRIQSYDAQPAAVGQHEIAQVGPIEFADVSFRYANGKSVLDEVSFRIQPGEIVGLIGRSGGGKSTLVELLIGVREPSSGTIHAGGINLCSIDRRSWSSLVSFVPQNPLLISGSIADNVRFFRDGLSDSAVLEALRMANLDHDIGEMPGGINALIGERGNGLSGGQRQRLTIARALIKSPNLLILDEPTSALDPDSESALLETLLQLPADITVVIIAHRLSTLEICDRIIVVERGLVETVADSDAPKISDEYFASERSAVDPAGPEERHTSG